MDTVSNYSNPCTLSLNHGAVMHTVSKLLRLLYPKPRLPDVQHRIFTHRDDEAHVLVD